MTRIALALALLAGCATPSTPSTPLVPPAPEPSLRTWTSGDAGFHTNSHWIDTGSEVVVFDTQFTPDLAQELLDAIAAETDSPVRWAVVTHPNPDKFNGASVFAAAGATVVASEATAAALADVHAYKKGYFTSVGMFTEETYPPLATIDLTFADSLDLPVDGLPVRLEVLEHPGVTTTQTVAYVGDGVVVGDLVAAETHAWLEGGIVDGVATPDLAGWREALSELEERVPASATVYAGRGPSLPASTVLPAQRAYLDQAEELVRAHLASLDDPAATLQDDGAAQYAAIAAALDAAAPSAHPYLVEYGVYGLAWQLVAEAR